MSDLPAALVPESGARGLATGDRALLASTVLTAWDEFIAYAQTCELDQPSRKKGWTGHDVVVQIGAWPDARRAEAVLADARSGRVHTIDQDADAERLRFVHRDSTAGEALDALRVARSDVDGFLESADDSADGLRLTASPLGALPVRTLFLAMTYQLAVCALDLEPCSSVPAPDALVDCGLIALVDTTGALAARHGVTGSVSALVPGAAWGFGAQHGDWRTRALAPDEVGPAVEASARVILDITAGRVADVPGLYRKGEIRLHDLGGLLRMAPVVDSVPGIPGGAALRQATRVLGGVAKVTNLFRRR